jgi:hypothetical protein
MEDEQGDDKFPIWTGTLITGCYRILLRFVPKTKNDLLKVGWDFGKSPYSRRIAAR